MKALKLAISVFLFFMSGISIAYSQMITGVWTGKINRQKVEVKIVQKGGSLTGTTYYYESPNNYQRYSIKGYFDPATNEAVWWDDQLIEESGGKSSGDKTPMLSRADFNCPGYGKMMLDGKSSRVNNERGRGGELNLDKTDWSGFADEWDFVLENFTAGANDPDIIDSVELISMAKKTIEEQPIKSFKEIEQYGIAEPEQPKIAGLMMPKPEIPMVTIEPPKPSAIQQKYASRKKVFATEIPVNSDSVELHFYDNAQIDGDSISLFLNDRLIFEHIRLTEKAYTIKIAAAQLNASNELIMVAENLGSIPPNTSYMVAIAGDKRYEARLESTEGSSALIRLVKPKTE